MGDARLTQIYAEVYHSQPPDIILTGSTPLSRTRVFQSGGSLNVVLFSSTPLSRTRAFQSGGVVDFAISVPSSMDLALEMSGSPAVIVPAGPVNMEMALEMAYFPLGGQVTGTLDLQQLTGKLAPTMPVAFIKPLRLVGKLDPSSDEIDITFPTD